MQAAEEEGTKGFQGRKPEQRRGGHKAHKERKHRNVRKQRNAAGGTRCKEKRKAEAQASCSQALVLLEETQGRGAGFVIASPW